ncbi:hypothetical protein [Acinetobacter sp. YH01008]|uniref:hypothetical protein n=1 Tax=Acinetobacter sp. YH01008 TaxID=2601024 RepID=UPI00211ED485|nr:hypothetical protein [Acinetobacter sp. YH01008]
MDIEKLKTEFEQTECFKRLEHVAQYTFFEFGAYIKRTDVPADIEKKCGKLITSLLFSWSAWKEAKAQAVPEGFILVPKEPTEAMIQRGTKANSECLNENAPLGERLFRHPTLQVYQAMVNGSGE